MLPIIIPEKEEKVNSRFENNGKFLEVTRFSVRAVLADLATETKTQKKNCYELRNPPPDGILTGRIEDGLNIQTLGDGSIKWNGDL